MPSYKTTKLYYFGQSGSLLLFTKAIKNHTKAENTPVLFLLNCSSSHYFFLLISFKTLNSPKSANHRAGVYMM